MSMVKNSLGRLVPTEVNGRSVRPFMGAHADAGGGMRYGGSIPAAARYGNKLLTDLDAAIDACAIRDGMVISFHHHLRNGDFLVNLVIEKLAARGLKDLVLAPSALFPGSRRPSRPYRIRHDLPY